MSQEKVKELPQETEAREAWVWLSFFAPRRQYYCDANQKMLDQWLTENGKVLSVENLLQAVEALRPQLAVLNLEAQNRRQAAVEGDKKAEIQSAQPSGLPEEYTRRRLIKMGKDEFIALRKKYGDDLIESRVNSKEEA